MGLESELQRAQLRKETQLTQEQSRACLYVSGGEFYSSLCIVNVIVFPFHSLRASVNLEETTDWLASLTEDADISVPLWSSWIPPIHG